MQRPLLVLIIVLVAILALVFAVLNLGGHDKQNQTPVQPTQQASANNGGPVVPPTLANNPTRKDAPVKTAPHAGAGNPTQAMQFDNRLTGLVNNTLGQPVANAEVTLSTMWTYVMSFQNDV